MTNYLQPWNPYSKSCKINDHLLQHVMEQGDSYTKNTRHFLAKLKTSAEVLKRTILGSHVVKVWEFLKHSMNGISRKTYIKKI